ncbi:MAG TPA: glutathione S-transferase family protein [Acetobacteraceae bacterium]|nr:glutathione S-transferase family protein [Acetobacteraceae bacterium]
MLLYDSVGPNPRTVRVYMAERGIDIPRQEVDLRGGENRREPYLSKVPFGQLPALELDDGTVISEITAICEYLDETRPGPRLFGDTAEQRAVTRMWTRRLDLNIVEPMANGFRFSRGLKFFQNRIRVIPQAADDLKLVAQEWLTRLDKMIAGRPWIAGERFSFVDIFLYCFLDFGAGVGQPLNPENRNIQAWFAKMAARPSVKA